MEDKINNCLAGLSMLENDVTTHTIPDYMQNLGCEFLDKDIVIKAAESFVTDMSAEQNILRTLYLKIRKAQVANKELGDFLESLINPPVLGTIKQE